MYLREARAQLKYIHIGILILAAVNYGTLALMTLASFLLEYVMHNYYQYRSGKGFWAKWICLAKFGSAVTQRSEVVLKPLLCIKMRSKHNRSSSELQRYAVIETKKKYSGTSNRHSSTSG